MCSEVWNAMIERSDYADEEDGEIRVRKLQWMAPQSPEISTEGCLFILLGSTGPSNDELRSVSTFTISVKHNFVHLIYVN